jgi:hypothetical protein
MYDIIGLPTVLPVVGNSKLADEGKIERTHKIMYLETKALISDTYLREIIPTILPKRKDIGYIK